MTFGTPQVAYLLLTGVGLAFAYTDNGKIKEESFRSTLLATGVNLSMLYWGGFFG